VRGQKLESQIWESVKKNIKIKNPNNAYLETWFSPIELIDTEESHKGTVFKLGVPTDFHKNWISDNFLDRICQEISSVVQKPFQVQLVVVPELEKSEPLAEQTSFTIAPIVSSTPADQDSGYSTLSKSLRQVLNIEYTFSTFVVGRNNEFDHAACYNVEKNPVGGYNPLFICGRTGMGKTL